MQDPPHTLHFNRVAHSDTENHQRLTDPSVVIPPGESDGPRTSASADRAGRKSSYDQNTDFAYGTNPTSDAIFCNPAYASNGANIVHDSSTTSQPLARLAVNSANAEGVSSLHLTSFDSQTWPASPGHYLAHQAVYDPADHLVHEQAQDFERFDYPPSLRSTTWSLEQEVITGVPTAGTPASGLNYNSHGAVKNGQIFPKPALKRSFDTDRGSGSHNSGEQQSLSARPEARKLRRVSFEQMSGTGPGSADDEESSSEEELPAQRQPAQRQPAQGRTRGSGRRGRGSSAAPGHNPQQRLSAYQASSGRPSAASTIGQGSKTPTGHPPSILPPEKVFPIQIGSELFRLSGASISSDAPSYFTQFFEEQLKQNQDSGGVRTLYIDRDPETFRDVARHLQGYFIKPRDGSHFVKLFADAQFYSLPRLINQLFEAEIFIQIGEKHFQIPKDIFSDPGNSPNFFSLGFAVFFSSPGEVFPGLDRRGLLRPPSITPPYVPGRSAATFAQLLHLLRGYQLQIRDDEHRNELLRDCRYFHLRGLEQKIIAHDISYNLQRQQTEICLRIEDIKPSGISYKGDEAEDEHDITGGWVRYARPFVDDNSYELLVEIGEERTILDLNEMRLDFHGLTKARVSSLFQVVANKMNLPTNAPLGAMLLSGGGETTHASPGHTPLSEDRVKVRFEVATDIILDGFQYDVDWNSALGQCMSHGPGKSTNDSEDSDAMSEGMPAETQRPAHRPRAKPSQPASISGGIPQNGPSTRAHSSSQAAAPRLETVSSNSRKRRRPTLSTASTASGFGEWVIRTGQWRLRVQQSEQDPIRGGYEIVFMAVKLDAFSQERARNTRRKFLGGGG